MNIRAITPILVTCHRLAHGQAFVIELANALEEPPGMIRELLEQNGIITLDGQPSPGTLTQDIVNTIVLFYAMKPYHTWVKTAFLRSNPNPTPAPSPNHLPSKPLAPPKNRKS